MKFFRSEKHQLLLLTIVTIVGALAYALGYKDIIKFTPLYLLVSGGILLSGWYTDNASLRMGVTAAIIGFCAEVLGVKTGLLFGNYSYGTVLGPTLLGVPIIVGVLWAIVTMVLWAQTERFAQLGFKRIWVVAAAAVVYDVTLEHFAVRFGLWSWAGSIPLSNAAGWFGVSAVIAFVFYKQKLVLKPTKITQCILPLQTLFFLLLLVLH